MSTLGEFFNLQMTNISIEEQGFGTNESPLGGDATHAKISISSCEFLNTRYFINSHVHV